MAQEDGAGRHLRHEALVLGQHLLLGLDLQLDALVRQRRLPLLLRRRRLRLLLRLQSEDSNDVFFFAMRRTRVPKIQSRVIETPVGTEEACPKRHAKRDGRACATVPSQQHSLHSFGRDQGVIGAQA